MPAPNVIVQIPVQFTKILSGTTEFVGPKFVIVMFVNDIQPLKISIPAVTFAVKLGKVNEFKWIQFSNIFFPNVVIETGKETTVTLQALNA